MKRMRPFAVFAVAILALAALSLGGLLVDGLRHARAHDGPASPTLGDANGDGMVDLSDPVYLLVWLFRRGPPPAVLECPPAPSADCDLPASGQSACYDDAGQEVPCGSAEYPGQDGAYLAGCSGGDAGRFEDHGDGTVTDRCTGLMWQQDGSAPDFWPWQDALFVGESIVLAMDGSWLLDPDEAAAHGGVRYDDWRLPSARELGSLVDFGRSVPAADPAITVFPGGTWSSTSIAAQPGQAWCVNFFWGATEPAAKLTGLRVIVCRDAE